MTKSTVGKGYDAPMMSGRSAVIYCYVASATSSGFDAAVAMQELYCRCVAHDAELPVARTFSDYGLKTSERPGIKALLAYLSEHEGSVVVIQDIVRLGRTPEKNAALRRTIASTGATLLIARDPGFPSSRIVREVTIGFEGVSL